MNKEPSESQRHKGGKEGNTLSFYGSLRIPSLLVHLQDALGSSLLQEASRTCSFLYLLQPPSRKQHFPQQLLAAQSQPPALSPLQGTPRPHCTHPLLSCNHQNFHWRPASRFPQRRHTFCGLRRSLFQVRQRPQEGRCYDHLEYK